jgi:membrane fusion protein
MSNSLFRHEVMEARQTKWLGSISLSQPLSLWLLTAVATLIAFSIVLFLAFGEYTRRTRVNGQLYPSEGLATITSPMMGYLQQVSIKEGERVNAGNIIAVVSNSQATLNNGDTLQALQSSIETRQNGITDNYQAQKRQIAAQQAGVNNQLNAIRGELVQIQKELITRKQQQLIAEKNLERFRDLKKQGYVTDLQLQQQESAALDQVNSVQLLERERLSTQRLMAQLQQNLNELPAQASSLQAAEKRDIATLDQQSVETAARGQLVIKAPVTGMVSTVIGQAGQAVQPGQALMSVLPDNSPLEAHLYVPSRAVGFIEPKDTVLLRYQAFPYQKFGHYKGTVTRISRSALSAAELNALGLPQASEIYYRVIVRLDSQSIRAFGKNEALRPGLVLEADILGEKRKLWEWVLEPLYSLTGQF